MTDDFSDQPLGATPLDDVSGLRSDSVFTRRDLDEVETINIYQAFEWLSGARVEDVFTVDFYVTLHRKMFCDVWDWAGVLRTQTGDQVGHPFVRAEQVAAELGRVAYEFYRDWESQDGALLTFLARYHHALVVVHPFNNGNGRWSRLATDAILICELDEPPLEWGSDDLALGVDSEERQSYIAALRSADAFDFQPLVHYLSELNPLIN